MDVEKLKEGIIFHKKNSPKTYKKDIDLGVPIFVLHKNIINGIDRILNKKYEMTNIELDVLSSLVLGGGDECILSPTQLYDRLVFSSGGMTKVLKKLELKEFITRVENSEDKRSKLVKLTSKGREICDKALKEVVTYECQYFECLEKGEKENLKSILFKVLENN
ncbi:MarR family winged helix-turn-helix transcriptional regulator [Arcobacter sp. LA11]|uniref:MarR family winged helix-turn-helix transcriptional regulator n=1 Tax=Arcobacter sp. LA11 TaxID=1898176 RepID=UPI0009FA3F18|nr:MarR family transcriptional regulator [Arcobacter sp. LA11]